MNEPNFTDWLASISTAVAALFAIIGVIFAWKSFKKDISGQQHQIDALVNFTDALGKQTETLKESAKIDSQILGKLTEHIGISSGISKEQVERYKLEIRPYFIFSFSTGGYRHDYKLTFTNDGGDMAIITSIKLLDNAHEFIIRNSNLSGQRINKGSKITIELSRGAYQGGWDEVECKIELRFSDKTAKNLYKQTINFDYANVKIGNVEEIQSSAEDELKVGKV